MTSRPASSRPASVSSHTALALAPGVLNTHTPACEQRSMGMLLTPAPARAMDSSVAGSSMSCMDALRTNTASGWVSPAETA